MELKLSPKDYKSEQPTWCPGCGHFAILNALQKAAAELEIPPHEIALVTGIGCSGKLSSFFNAYGFHGIHGRTLPLATGIKLANPELTVIASGGDGDGYSIGLSHILHTARRNVDITYIVMDNRVYGLTKGQTSPTSLIGFNTKTSPSGSVETPIQPLALAVSAGATYVAQGFSGDLKQVIELIINGILHKGFAIIDIFSPCVTFNLMRQEVPHPL